MKEIKEEKNVMVLIKLLDTQWRLPRPKGCPHEVTSPLSTIDILLASGVARLFYNDFFPLNQQVGMLMEQCWAAEPAKRPSFGSLIEMFEAIRQTYNWQPHMNFSLA